jgi:hypothetical protein
MGGPGLFSMGHICTPQLKGGSEIDSFRISVAENFTDSMTSENKTQTQVVGGKESLLC